jgi:predicted transcriptional regulator
MNPKNQPHNSQSHENYLLIFTTIALAERSITNGEISENLGFAKQYTYKKTKYLLKKGYLESESLETDKNYGEIDHYRLSKKGMIMYQMICDNFGTLIF